MKLTSFTAEGRSWRSCAEFERSGSRHNSFTAEERSLRSCAEFKKGNIYLELALRNSVNAVPLR